MTFPRTLAFAFLTVCVSLAGFLLLASRRLETDWER